MALLLLALIAIGSIVALLLLTGTAYRTYFETAAWIHFILGPATVALAIPLYKNIGEIRRSTLAIGAAVAAGAITASGSAMDSRNSSDIGYLRPPLGITPLRAAQRVLTLVVRGSSTSGCEFLFRPGGQDQDLNRGCRHSGKHQGGHWRALLDKSRIEPP